MDLLAFPLLLLIVDRGGPVVGEESGPDLHLPAQRRALVFGASKYERLERLNYAAHDARVFADALVEELGFAREQDELPAVQDETWQYYPAFNFGVRIADGKVTGLTVTPILVPQDEEPAPEGSGAR